MKHISTIVCLALVVCSTAALAHGGQEHLKGVVLKIDGAVLTLKGEKGDVVVQTDPKTEYKRGEQELTLRDIAVGDRVVIHATEHDEKFLAKLVKLAPAGKPMSAPDAGRPILHEEPGHVKTH